METFPPLGRAAMSAPPCPDVPTRQLRLRARRGERPETRPLVAEGGLPFLFYCVSICVIDHLSEDILVVSGAKLAKMYK